MSTGPRSRRATSSMSMRAVADPLAEVGIAPGTVVDRTYRIERLLGAGGMGVVALAHDERLHRNVAIKFVKPTFFAVPEAHSLFLREARAMARIAHRNVLSIYASGDHAETPFFVMEYVDGRTCEQWLHGAAADVDDAVAVLEQACQGVEAIHGAGLVHRDLKPSNLLIDKSFRVAVADFGVARAPELMEEGSPVLVGTPEYIAPEAAFGESGTREEARDIYALGCIAYELLTGRPPFVGESEQNVLTQHVIQAPIPPSERRPSLGTRYDEVVLRALAKNVDERYPTAAAFREAIVGEHRGTRGPGRILVVDDDPEWRALVGSGLEKRFPGAKVDRAADGGAALEAFLDGPYDVCVVDLEMPEVDGTKLTSHLRSLESAARTAIVVLTAAGGPREWKRLSEIGADAFLVKPVDNEDLELVIRRTLRARRSAK